MEAHNPARPLSVRLTVWWAYIFATMYLLYGGVKIVLSILDRQYGEMDKPFMFLILGVVLIIVSIAYRDGKRWGWYGVVVINALVVLMAVLKLGYVENIVLLVVAALALVGLFLPTTKSHVFGHH